MDVSFEDLEHGDREKEHKGDDSESSSPSTSSSSKPNDNEEKKGDDDSLADHEDEDDGCSLDSDEAREAAIRDNLIYTIKNYIGWYVYQWGDQKLTINLSS